MSEKSTFEALRASAPCWALGSFLLCLMGNPPLPWRTGGSTYECYFSLKVLLYSTSSFFLSSQFIRKTKRTADALFSQRCWSSYYIRSDFLRWSVFNCSSVFFLFSNVL